MKPAKVIGSLLALIVSGLALGPAGASAATFTPDDLDEFGGCTLREAITAANTDGDFNGCSAADEGADTIVLQGGSTYSLTLVNLEDANAGGDLDVVDESLTISVTGIGMATIECTTCADRVLHVAPTGGAITVQVSNVVIENGAGNAQGGNVHNGANGTVMFSGSVVRNNTSASSVGGGISNVGALTLTNSTVSGNTGNGGGVQSSGTLTITNSTISGNQTATSGGQSGGGVNSGGTLTITNSTISGNTSQTGGGLAVAGAVTVNLSNVTVSGNQAHGRGGGIKANTFMGTVNLANVTVAGNTADFDDTDDDGGTDDGGGLYREAGTVNLRNSIIADNADATTGGGTVHPDCSGTVTSQGYNLVENTTGCSGVTGTGDVTGMDPMLGGLGNNGGPTQTRALPTNSPAANAGNPATPDGSGTSCLATDQRGLPRGGGAGQCDMGAFENQPAAPLPPPTTTTPLTQPAPVPFDLAAAIKKCKKKFEKGTKARTKCIKKARARAQQD